MDENSIFRIENRIRGVLMGLIEPTIRRSKEGQDLLAMLTHKLETLSTKVEDIDIIQSKTLTKLSYFEEFNRKFMEFNASQSLLE